jgi:hypothetical protein
MLIHAVFRRTGSSTRLENILKTIAVVTWTRAQFSLRRRTLDHGPADVLTSQSIKLNDAPRLRLATNYALIHLAVCSKRLHNCYTKNTVSTQ